MLSGTGIGDEVTISPGISFWNDCCDWKNEFEERPGLYGIDVPICGCDWVCDQFARMNCGGEGGAGGTFVARGAVMPCAIGV